MRVRSAQEAVMSRPKPWEVDDDLWALIEPLLPVVERRPDPLDLGGLQRGERGRADRLRSARPAMPCRANRSRQVRTVSRCRPVSRAMRALERPRAAWSTM